MKNFRDNGRRVAIVCGLRTPFAKSGTVFRNLSSLDLGRIVTVELVNRSEIDPKKIDEVIFGTVIPSVKTPNLAREISLDSGIPHSVPAYTVARACASANQAITNAVESIALGNADVVIAGGTESLSDFPLLFSRKFKTTLNDYYKGRNISQKVKPFFGLSLRDLAPDIPSLAELSTGLTMAQAAEKTARENGISRKEQDAFAYRSHRLASQATEAGVFKDEIIRTLVPPDFSTVVSSDNGIRKDTSVEALSGLIPVADERYGTVTIGNSSPLSDGASVFLIMSEEKANALGYKPLGYVCSYAYAALSPGDSPLMGPTRAIPLALDRARLTLKDIDLIEMHEAFAAQTLANVNALASKSFAEDKLGRSESVGEVDIDKLNVLGGSIAVGHPFGATGGRLTITILNELGRRGGNFGLISVCAAGGLGAAMIVERE